jgi:hypothetical protein
VVQGLPPTRYFARSGNRASRTVILPASPVMHHHSDPPEPFPHNEEPQLRKLGPTTVMRKGVPTLENPHKLCEQGKVLTAEKAQLAAAQVDRGEDGGVPGRAQGAVRFCDGGGGGCD